MKKKNSLWTSKKTSQSESAVRVVATDIVCDYKYVCIYGLNCVLYIGSSFGRKRFSVSSSVLLVAGLQGN